MKYFTFLIVTCLFVGCKSTDKTESFSSLDSSCIPIVDKFFQKVESGDYKVALDELLSSNVNIDHKDSAVIAMKERFFFINQVSGAFRGKSLLKKKTINDDIATYSYLAKYDKKFYRFVFMFYNNGLKIETYKFMFDDTMEIEIEESLKLYM